MLGGAFNQEAIMTEYKSDLLRLLSERGHIHQLTDAQGLDALAQKDVVVAYNGYDATASSLHVGNLASVMLLRRLQQAGHKPIALMGGGTTKVGDPSGKDESRKLLTEETIASNIAGIAKVFHRLLRFDDSATGAHGQQCRLADQLGYIDLLRNVGPHFTVNRMLTFDSVKLRLDREQPLTFLEFNYMILQAYDFRELALRHGCRLQLGGSDQWGNIVNGIELTRRMNGIELFGLTTPLLTTADGAKMGKSVNGAVWLNEELLPHYDFWQFWRNTDDRDVGRFLRIFTDVPLDEIVRLEALQGSEINAAKVVLANEVTSWSAARKQPRPPRRPAPPCRRRSGRGPAGLACARRWLHDHRCVGRYWFCGKPRRGQAPGRGRRRQLDGAAISDENHAISLDSGEIRLSSGKKKHGILKAQ
jgi:tyrosyl-tRNA synthetase